jgi:hypothetical protein
MDYEHRNRLEAEHSPEAVRGRLENHHGPGYLGDAVLGGIDGCVAQPVLTGPSIFYRRILPRNRR